MTKTLLLLAVLFGLDAFANDCNELKIWRIRLGLTASNLQNVNTTRTPEGGPYRPFRIQSCQGGGCTVTREKKVELRYLPEHPDSNREGYVAFPRIDSHAELRTMTVIAKKLKSLALVHTCGSSVETDGSIHYKPDGEQPLEDDFIFDRRDQLITWAEINHRGQLSAVDLGAQGQVLRHR